MGKKDKKQIKVDKSIDITIRLLEDPRITSKDIELYNLVLEEFPNSQIDDPITVLKSKINALQTYNNYIKRTLNTSGLTDEQIKKYLSNSYVRYYAHILGLNN